MLYTEPEDLYSWSVGLLKYNFVYDPVLHLLNKKAQVLDISGAYSLEILNH